MKTASGWDKEGGNGGWTRLDVGAGLLGLALVGVVMVPLVAAPPRVTKLAACANNLRTLGTAAAGWASDHQDRMPFRVPWGEGGTMPDGQDPWGGGLKPGLTWLEWAALSNYLENPRYLVCPEDKVKRIATDWTITNASGGLLHVSLRDRALSYILGTDVFDWAPRGILSGDRHLQYNSIGACSARINNVATVFTGGPNTVAGWTNAIHGVLGQVLFNDGSVETLSREGFQEVVARPESDDNGTLHFLRPF